MSSKSTLLISLLAVLIGTCISPAFADSSSRSRRLIMEKLDTMQGLGKYEISVDVQGGVARIEGTAPSAESSRRIEEAVQTTEGINTVYNTIEVVPSEPQIIHEVVKKHEPTDREIELEVVKAINSTGINDPGSIKVEVQSGIATLRGERNTFREIDQILASTLMVDGVKDVKSEIALANKVPGWDGAYQSHQ